MNCSLPHRDGSLAVANPLTARGPWPARLSAPVDPDATRAAYWWQSRQGLRVVPQLTDLRALARQIRSAAP